MPEHPNSPLSRDAYVGKLASLHGRMWNDKVPDRATRAQLRRCKSPDEAMWVAGGAVWRELGSPKGNDFEPVMIAAIVVAHVKNSGADTLADRLGKSEKFSETRFRRLIQTETLSELLPHILRALKIAGEEAKVRDLSRSILFWNDKTKRDWAFAYFQASAANPDNERHESLESAQPQQS